MVKPHSLPIRKDHQTPGSLPQELLEEEVEAKKNNNYNGTVFCLEILGMVEMLGLLGCVPFGPFQNSDPSAAPRPHISFLL